MPKPYYTLAEWDSARGAWCPQFGDYSRRVVREELRDTYQNIGTIYRIFESGDTQAEITKMLSVMPAPRMPAPRNRVR